MMLEILLLSGRGRESGLGAGQPAPVPALGHISDMHVAQAEAMQITWEATNGSVAICLSAMLDRLH